MEKLNIVFVSAEVAPYAKTGGLADVAGALPSELESLGLNVITIMPRYGNIDKKLDYVTDFPITVNGEKKTCIVKTDSNNNDKTYFIDNHQYYDRDGIYGYYDDGERFAFFSIAAIEFLKKIEFKTNILHLNDWHVGPMAMMIKEKYANDKIFENTKIIYTIHNLRYQGLFPKDILKYFGVSESVFNQETTEYYGQFNFMKAGIAFSDLITTVSETYSKEILSPEYGEGLDGFLKVRKDRLMGIVNGIDINDYDPMSKEDLYFPYSVDNISGKYKNKNQLKKELKLEKNNYPLFATISRLADQKGLNLILESVYQLAKENENFQFILLGTGNPHYEEEFRKLQNKYPDKISINIKFDLSLAKRIYAGCDIFLMPSKYEPCGLGQLISYRYGTIPLVRETGGLKDTVIDVKNGVDKATGFTFNEFSQDKLYKKMKEAIKLYENTNEWKKLVKKVMKLDYSWGNSAKKYKEIYCNLINDNG